MKLKHATASLLAALLAVCALPSISAQAITTYDPCDVNHSGAVDIMDVIVLNRYLIGDLYVPNYNLLDANRNQIVDYADGDCVMAKVTNVYYHGCFINRTYDANNHILTAGIQEFPTIPSYLVINDGDALLTNAKAYTKINCSNFTHTNYWLSPSLTPINNTSQYNIQSIVDGSDDRYSTTLSENSGIVKISYSDSGGTYTSTGFIIGDHLIATAAHCVIGVKYSYPLTITPHNANGTLASSSANLHPVEVHIPTDYWMQVNQLLNDYALIVVSDDLSNYPHFSIANTYNLKEEYYTNVPIYVTGNPAYINEGLPNQIDNTVARKLYTDKGNIKNGPSNSLVYFNTDVTDGDSGAPIYTVTMQTIDEDLTYQYSAIGVMHGDSSNTSNCGVRFTKYHLAFFFNNDYITDVDNMQ